MESSCQSFSNIQWRSAQFNRAAAIAVFIHIHDTPSILSLVTSHFSMKCVKTRHLDNLPCPFQVDFKAQAWKTPIMFPSHIDMSMSQRKSVSLCAVMQFKLVERKLFIHETAHKVHEFSWITKPLFQEGEPQHKSHLVPLYLRKSRNLHCQNLQNLTKTI